MRPSNTLIQSILSSGKIGLVELYDITLSTGQTYHFTGGDLPLSGITVLTPQGSIGPFNYASGFIIVRGKVSQKIGVEAGQLDVTFAPQLDYTGGPPLIAGYPIQQAARYGFLNGARFSYNELYLNPAIGANTSAVGFFSGTIQETHADRLAAYFTVEDLLAYLGNQQMPRPLFGTGCFHTVYDQGCTLLKSNFTVAGTVTSVGDAAHFVASGMSQPTGYFKLGQLTFTSGANSGVSGPVNSFTHPGAFAMGFPFPVAPSIGDTFTVYPGCDLQQATCSNNNSAVGPAFNNLAHFGGEPYTPQPLTLLDGGTDNPPAQVPGATAGTVIGSQPSGKSGYGPYKT
jgi:Uncharacterized conserved protein (DUF2163)/Phage conserved hypothetical protein BR0599